MIVARCQRVKVREATAERRLDLDTAAGFAHNKAGGSHQIWGEPLISLRQSRVHYGHPFTRSVRHIVPANGASSPRQGALKPGSPGFYKCALRDLPLINQEP